MITPFGIAERINTMAERITIQDIADELGVSRNTVSKAINNTGILAESTRKKVLKKAIEMGYKQFSYVNMVDLDEAQAAPVTVPREITLFFSGLIGSSHFSSTMMDSFQREISQAGYSFNMYPLRDEDIDKLQLPLSFDREKTAGIICIEMFNSAYNSMLCALGIPILFVDSAAPDPLRPLNADLLLMDNQSNILKFIREMNRRGKNRIGFIGKYTHCQSFYERFMGYRNAMYQLSLPVLEEYCITGNKEGVKIPASFAYQEYLIEHLQNIKKLPDVFICANDFTVLDVLQVFKQLGIRVPDDVYLCGFDDSPESKIVSPTLTTIHIHTQIMGFSAAQLLLSRIKEPSLHFRTIHTQTSLIYRESTGD